MEFQGELVSGELAGVRRVSTHEWEAVLRDMKSRRWEEYEPNRFQTKHGDEAVLVMAEWDEVIAVDVWQGDALLPVRIMPAL